MKKILFLAALIYSQIILGQSVTDGLVGYWPMDGNVTDYSGNSNNGTIFGDVNPTTDRNENQSGALYFDGDGDYIDLGYVLEDQINEFSISVWIKTSQKKSRIISRRPGDVHFEFHVNSSGRLSYYDGGSAYLDHLSISDNEWHHVVLTVNHGIANLYIDNNKSSDLASNISILNTSTKTLCGAINSLASDHFFSGSMDELIIYNIALSDDQIFTLYNEYSPPQSSIQQIWTKANDSDNIYYNLGNVGIGTATTGSHKLAVEGSIGAREIKVETTIWPDFVFENDYELRNLDEVENYISENNRLPEIPSEAEVTENGINLGEMDAKLLQKIEELTLYLIEQNKEIKELKEKMEKLENE